MAIRIISAQEPLTVQNLIITLYSMPGMGKTTTAFTADKPLLLDFDNGIIRAAKRGDAVQITTWSEVSGLSADDLKSYNTIVIDVVGRCLEVLSDHLIRQNPKYGKTDGALSLQGFGALNTAFRAFLTKLRGFGKDIVLLAHAKEDKDGDTTSFRIDAVGSSKQEITKLSDLLGYIYSQNNKRVIGFNPTDSYIGKNCANLANLEMPNVKTDDKYLANLIAQAKATLNGKSADQVKSEADAAAKIDEAILLITSAETAESCTTLIANPLINTRHLKEQLLIHATALDFVFDKTLKQFVNPSTTLESDNPFGDIDNAD